MRLIITFIFIMSQIQVFANNKNLKSLGIQYFSRHFGHVHQNPSRYSTALTTIACGHPVKIFKSNLSKEESSVAADWRYVKAGPYMGYIHKSHLSKKTADCFQDRYPKFFENLSLDLSEMFYWGKLYDQYLMGKSKAQ